MQESKQTSDDNDDDDGSWKGTVESNYVLFRAPQRSKAYKPGALTTRQNGLITMSKCLIYSSWSGGGDNFVSKDPKNWGDNFTSLLRRTKSTSAWLRIGTMKECITKVELTYCKNNLKANLMSPIHSFMGV